VDVRIWFSFWIFLFFMSCLVMWIPFSFIKTYFLYGS
jgi:hypothetical protein